MSVADGSTGSTLVAPRLAPPRRAGRRTDRRIGIGRLLFVIFLVSAAMVATTANEYLPKHAAAAGADESTLPQPKTRWRPELETSWQWQLSVPVDTTVNVPVYDIDMFENSAAVVAALHAAGRKVICYVDVGSYEDFRPDKGEFPASVLGKSNGWPGEQWLDIRQISILEPIMARRFDECAAKGFDGVEPDIMDGYQGDTGFPITAADQLRYNEMIADLAHQRGLAVGLKNDLSQIRQLVGIFDFAVNEECAQYKQCQLLTPFIAAAKPVFNAEYTLTTAQFCPITTALGFASIRKLKDLGAWREPCTADTA